MAVLTSLEKFKSEIDGLDTASCPHVWPNDTGGINFGVFPSAEACFDFGAEKMGFLSEVWLPKASAAANPITRELRDVRGASARKTTRTILKFSNLDLVCGSAKQALLEGLEEVERRAPGTLETLSAQKGRSKRPVHRNRDELYDLKTQRRFAEQIPCGFWVATNNKTLEAHHVVRRAAQISGLPLEIVRDS